MNKRLRETLIKSLRLLLRPVARFCIKHSFKIQDIVENAKQELILVARSELESKKARVSVSKISAMTGLQRKDVVRLLDESEVESSGRTSLVMKIIGQWRYDKRFLTSSGKPRSLSIEPGDNEFEDLVTSVSTDLNAFTVLFELERLGYVKRKGKNRVTLESYVNTSISDVRESFEILAYDVDLFVQAVDQNVFEQPETNNLHLSTRYDNILLEKVPLIRKWVLDEGSRFHKRVRDYVSKFDKDIDPKLKGEAGGQITVGSFSWTRGEISEDSE